MKSKKNKKNVLLYIIVLLGFIGSIFYVKNYFIAKENLTVESLVGSTSTIVHLQLRIIPGNLSAIIDPDSFEISSRKENGKIVAQQSFLICLKNRRNKNNGWSISLQNKSEDSNQPIYLSLQDNNMISKDNQVVKDWPVGIISGIKKKEIIDQPLLIFLAQKNYGRGDYCFRPVINFSYLPFDAETTKIDFIVSIL
ncbi:MAG: hypothetical protein KAS12_00265 [Candidatus Aenigmarchaeota archaeon]|nr:hypothetical protein [Candidatus Aenigmarchaeota archaeon]